METLLKWPGGKGREFQQVRPYIPSFETYVEPFFGGGAFFFNLMPQNALLNDANSKLMGLYAYVRECAPTFEDTIYDYVCWWENLQKTIEDLQPPLLELYQGIHGGLTMKELSRQVAEHLCRYEATFLHDFSGFFGDPATLWRAIEISVQSKYARLPRLERDNDVRFDKSLMQNHVATAVRAGMYTYFRDEFSPRSEAEDVANFYFLREFCYGSMFRFNKEGKFNIPYGGIGYNSKDFRNKANRLFSAQTRALFANAQLFNLDFRLFFEMNWEALDQQSFCFLDPPYDTEFSAYDNLAFTLKDQETLADIFAQLPCKAMAIMKDTDYICALYRRAQDVNSQIQIACFDKTYGYNVRGRNERETQHLMVCNYPLAAHTLIPEYEQITLL